MDMKTTERLVRLIAKSTCKELGLVLDFLRKQIDEPCGSFWTLVSNLKSTTQRVVDIAQSLVSTLESIEDAVIIDAITQVAPPKHDIVQGENSNEEG